MDCVGIGLLGLGVLIILVVAVVGLFIARALYRGGKSAVNEGGSLLSHAEHGIEGMLSAGAHGLTHGQKIGRVIDATDSLGNLLVSGGYMEGSEWQPVADKITAAVAQAKHAAPVAAEVPPA